MTTDPSLKKTILEYARGATVLNLAFIGVAKGLFDALAEGPLTSDELARRAGVDPGYCAAWCDAAFAFGHLDEDTGRVELTPLGRAFVRGGAESLFAVPVGAVMGAHMAERAAFYSTSGERPGDLVQAERETLVPLMGPLSESHYAPLFTGEIVTRLEVFAEVDHRRGTVVDLGCGNGWYLRALARRFPALRGVGLDDSQQRIVQARDLATAEGLADRLEFREGDLRHFTVSEPVELIVMNRALHHVWEAGQREVFEILASHLQPGGSAAIWEPAWPELRAQLRHPSFQRMAMQNLSEHVQGNHYLHPHEIERAFAEVGMTATTHLFRDGSEAVVVGRKA